MWIIAGTVPEAECPLLFGPCAQKNGRLTVAGRKLAVGRGTTALLSAACITAAHLNIPPPAAIVAGDIGNGTGSQAIYAALYRDLSIWQHTESPLPDCLTFHYLLPDLDWHNRILPAALALTRRPILIADAGYMYAAKMSGYAAEYDIFTPDAGELAFLADESAPHPFYTRGFLLAREEGGAELIAKSFSFGNAARYMLVKGKKDLVVCKGSVREVIDSPDLPVLEAIGGTGDTLTGVIAALAVSGLPLDKSCALAARTNRDMGRLARATPASSIEDLLRHLDHALALNKAGFAAKI